MADHNWLSLSVANELVRVAMELVGETDVERWTRRLTDDMMEWKPSREYRHYLGTYSMGIGNPRELYERQVMMAPAVERFCRFEMLVKRRRQATFRRTPGAGLHHAPVVLRLGERQVGAVPHQLGAAPRHGRRATVRGAWRGFVRHRGALAEPVPGPAVLDPDRAGGRRRGRSDGGVRRDPCVAVGCGGGRGRRCPCSSGERSATRCSSAPDGTTRRGCWICSPRRSCTRTTSSRRSFATSRQRSSSSRC